MNDFHIPVLADSVCRCLITDREGVYYDGTVGGGGHALQLLRQLGEKARYIAVDRDGEALQRARTRLNAYNNIHYYHGRFSAFEEALNPIGITVVDGMLFDLGLSSWQIDRENRGFTFSKDAPLDMRMDARQETTAADLLYAADEEALFRIFRDYGEERHARKIARNIKHEQRYRKVDRSKDLVEIICKCVPPPNQVKSYARIFQALRIAVNEELHILEEMLHHFLHYLKPGGRIAVIAYHSLEDRIVKRYFQKQENPCECPPEFPYCVCGNVPRLRRIKPFPMQPSVEEIRQNPRARSAKLRIGEKL